MSTAAHRIVAATLESRVAEEGPLSLHAALDAACQVARALETLHAQGRVHHDLRPGNVIAVSSLNYELADFGPSSEGSLPTAAAPEQQPGDAATPWSNQYQLGQLVVWMLGEVPSAAGGAPAAVDDAVRTLLASSPRHRFASMGAARKALETALAEYRAALLQKAGEPSGTHSIVRGQPAAPSRPRTAAPAEARAPVKQLTHNSRPVTSDAQVTLLLALPVIAALFVCSHYLF